MTARNVWEAANRSRKIERLLARIHLESISVDALDSFAFDWNALSVRAGCKHPPSDVTIGEVVRDLTERAGHNSTDHRCGACSDGRHADCSCWCFCPCSGGEHPERVPDEPWCSDRDVYEPTPEDLEDDYAADCQQDERADDEIDARNAEPIGWRDV